jgi:hypothetical protein
MNTVAKLWNKRKVKNEMTFNKPEGVTFGAMYAAQHWLKDNGYSYGSTSKDRKTCGNEPVAIMKGEYRLPQKWHNFTAQDKTMADGVMIAFDWREGDVRVILFEDKTIL